MRASLRAAPQFPHWTCGQTAHFHALIDRVGRQSACPLNAYGRVHDRTMNRLVADDWRNSVCHRSPLNRPRLIRYLATRASVRCSARNQQRQRESSAADENPRRRHLVRSGNLVDVLDCPRPVGVGARTRLRDSTTRIAAADQSTDGCLGSAMSRPSIARHRIDGCPGFPRIPFERPSLNGDVCSFSHIRRGL